MSSNAQGRRQKDGGPAFPASASVKRHNPVTGVTLFEPITSGGMSLRDWLAGTVEAGAIVAIRDQHDAEVLTGVKAPDADCSIVERLEHVMRVEARIRYIYADAMLAERDRKKEGGAV